MAIHYSLHENKLKGGDTYMALVRSIGTLDQDALMARMERRGTTLTLEDVMASLQLATEIIVEALLEGYNVVTPTANFSASIKGVFADLDDSFDPSRHSLEAKVNVGATLREAFGGATVEKTESITYAPKPSTFTDYATELKNSTATPGNGARVRGNRLKFDPADPAQGLFFVATDGTETAVTQIMTNKPSELVFLVPTLPAGDYTLVVRALFHKDVRSGTLKYTLTVA